MPSLRFSPLPVGERSDGIADAIRVRGLSEFGCVERPLTRSLRCAPASTSPLRGEVSASLRAAPVFQIRVELDKMRLKHQLPWFVHALSNSTDATSTVSFGQAIASSNGFAGAVDPTKPLTSIDWG